MERHSPHWPDGQPTTLTFPDSRDGYRQARRFLLAHRIAVPSDGPNCGCCPPRLEVAGWERCEPGSSRHSTQTAQLNHRITTAKATT